MSIDRFIAVFVPMKAKILCTVYRANIVVSVVVLLSYSVNSTLKFLHTPVNSRGKLAGYCAFALPAFWRHFYAYLRLVATYYGPIVILIAANIGIITVVAINTGRRHKLVRNGTSGKERRKENTITTMLLIVCVASVTFLLPDKTISIYFDYISVPDYTPRTWATRNFIASVTSFFSNLNYSMNFCTHYLWQNSGMNCEFYLAAQTSREGVNQVIRPLQPGFHEITTRNNTAVNDKTQPPILGGSYVKLIFIQNDLTVPWLN
jgi:hypothetical protein